MSTAAPPSKSSSEIVKYLDRIQGNVLEGFNKDYQTFLFLRFVDPAASRAWLGSMAPEIASVQEVRAFNDLFKLLNRRRKGELGILKATWMNIAFTFSGLQALGVPQAELDLFPEAFKQGMKARAGLLGDVGKSAPETWLAPFTSGHIHAVMIVASDSPADLGQHVRRYLHNMGVVNGAQLVYLQEGSVREDEPGHEHFGFRDGVSQPAIRHYDGHVKGGEPIQGNPGQDRLHVGEFVLGYPTQIPTAKVCNLKDKKGDPVFVNPNPDEGPASPQHGLGDETAPAWAVEGSYLVFRRLAQDVRAFQDHVAKLSLQVFPDLAPKDPKTAYDVMGAKLVGRYASGCPLELTADEEDLIKDGVLPSNFDPTAGDPSYQFPEILGDAVKEGKGLGNIATNSKFDNHFEFGDDPDGKIVPRCAHIRKTYPRDEPTPGGGESSTQGHRIMRRGIPFGTSFRPALGTTGHGGKPGVEEPGDRGLLFLCYQSSLERQFEFIQRFWVNSADFPGPPKPPIPDAQGNAFSVFPGSADGQDPIIAQDTEASDVVIPLPDPNDPKTLVDKKVTIQHFVTTTGGDYFFQPSIEAIYKIAGLPSPFTPAGIEGATFVDDEDGIDSAGFNVCQDALDDANKA